MGENLQKKYLSQSIEKIKEFYFETETKSDVDKYSDFYTYLRQWMLWYPDKFLDWIKPENGITLDTDQRIFIRTLARFDTTFYVASRSTGKSFVMVLWLFIYAITHPNVRILYSAQSKEASARILKQKVKEMEQFYPLLYEECKFKNKSKESVKIIFPNGAYIENTVNGEGALGSRAEVLIVDEAGFVDNDLMERVLLPIIDEPRKNVKNGEVNPHEFNSAKFISSAGYKNSSAHTRFIDMYQQQTKGNGTFALSTDYWIPYKFGRGLSWNKIKQRKKSSGKIRFEMNYGSIWAGSQDGGILSTQAIELVRTLENPVFTNSKEKNIEYFFGIDVARSDREVNNEGSIVIGKAHYNAGQIYNVDIVNIVKLSANLTFTNQAVKIKKLEQIYQPKAIIIDANVIGSGLRDELMKVQNDSSGNNYVAYNTLNTNKTPEVDTYKTILYSLQSGTTESNQTDITKCVMNVFSERKVRLLKAKQVNSYDTKDESNFKEEEIPYFETEMLIDEIFNLELKITSNTMTVTRRSRSLNKDRYSALSYLLWYCFQYENVNNKKRAKNTDISKYAGLIN